MSNVYDIFKYEVDAYGNMYVLYKRYNDVAINSLYASNEHSMKLHTPGKLWVRLCDSPIAFPLEHVLDSGMRSGKLKVDDKLFA